MRAIGMMSGTSLDAFLRARVIEPLGMKDTAFFIAPEQRNRLAAGYRVQDGKIVRAPDGPRGQGHYADGPRKNFAGGAGIVGRRLRNRRRAGHRSIVQHSGRRARLRRGHSSRVPFAHALDSGAHRRSSLQP